MADLIAYLQRRDPAGAAAFAQPTLVRAAVNQEFAHLQTTVRDGDEIAFFPPRDRRLMATIRVQAGPFDVGQELANLTGGRTDIARHWLLRRRVVRGASDAESLAALTLEHYPAMTEKALARSATTAEARWSLLGCTVIHRVGRLLPGEPIVLVLAAAAHREAALAATGFLIDWLKTRAPFWKSEQSTNGQSRWVEARAEDDDAAAKWDDAS